MTLTSQCFGFESNTASTYCSAAWRRLKYGQTETVMIGLKLGSVNHYHSYKVITTFFEGIICL